MIFFWLNTVKRASSKNIIYSGWVFILDPAALYSSFSYGSLISRILCKAEKLIPNWNGLILSLFIVPSLGTLFYVIRGGKKISERRELLRWA